MPKKTNIKTDWVKIKPGEIEKKVVELGKKGTAPEKIGLILRDQHGIPKAKLLGKRINQILKENGMETNSEYKNIVKKVDTLRKHIEKHIHDYTAKRSLITYTARINKMKKLVAQ